MSQINLIWRISPDRRLTLNEPRMIGVVNVTPDSFSDGGRLESVEDAVAHALALVEQGASVIDIGGESTRPGAERVRAGEQIRRTRPVVAELRHRSEVAISIDTTLEPVAEAALDAGANIINDVSAGREDERIFDLAAERSCGLIVMHRLAPPEKDSYSHQYEQKPRYEDVVADVEDFLRRRCEEAMSRGVGEKAIVIDPGLGFGKTVEQNYELIARVGELLDLGHPVLGAASRKSFIGAATGVERPDRRLAGSLAACVALYERGLRLFRVHDVAAHFQALAVTGAVERASKDVATPNG